MQRPPTPVRYPENRRFSTVRGTSVLIHFPENPAQPPKAPSRWPSRSSSRCSLTRASLTRVRPERNEWRFYRMEIWPDLFGRALLARQWGRIGTQGRVRLDPHPDAGAAVNALARLAHAKRRRSYRDRPA